ncbi:FxSxx-COOH system tetratricopeptide repeat protein [Actinoplanes sp. NPDC051851]|uniref:FxSxx-COOH system tetratricopeptide repeat protein n=1 Tax=Actinoplanes sp. NPDC051851 TaxID=3154753 RepID=UPI0034132E32
MDETITALTRHLGQTDPTSLAEILWLASQLPPHGLRRGAGRGGTVPEPGGAGDPAGTPATGPPRRTPPPPESRHPAPAPPPEDGAASLYLDGETTTRSTGLPTRAPAVPALSQTLRTSQALRPLRRRAPGRWNEELDEPATAEASATAGRPIPVFRPGEERWLDLAIVVDDSPSMVVWRRTVAELQVLLERLGAFRDVRLWRMDPGLDGHAPPLLRDGRSRHPNRPGGIRHPRELVSADGRRMIIMISDCVGPVWLRRTPLNWMEMWGRAGPVALIQPLPQRLWHRCALDIVRARLNAPVPGTANSRLRVATQGTEYRPAGVPIPVMEWEPRWLAPWTRLVAAPGGEAVWGAATFTGWSPRGRIFAGRTTVTEQTDDPAELLARIRADISPEAFALATYLSAAPLNLPVMRLVQHTMMPASRPRHLAELFLSGLLVRTTPHLASQDAERVRYDFQPGTREILTSALESGTALRVLSRVSEFIGRRYGAALDFPALVAGVGLPGALDETSRPFAEVAQTVLRTLGGRYENLADQLAEFVRRSEQSGNQNPSPHRRRPRAGLGESAVFSGGTVSTSPLPGTQQPVVWGGVPPRNPNFTGRADLLLSLREQLTSKVTAVLPHTLHGLGGVGKTQLAVEYVYQYRSDYDLIWWIPSEQASQVREALNAMAPRLNVPAYEDPNERLRAINDALRTQTPFRRWLLVFDNADTAAALEPFLSNPSGHILITSRNRNWSSFAQTVEVDVFERDESVALLRRRLPGISPEDADTLAERLGDLPLALEQSAAWQEATGTPASVYLELLSQQALTLLSEEAPADYPRPVAEVFGLAFEQLTQRAPAALQMLEMCAFLSSEPISVRLLRNGRHIAAQLPGPLGEALNNEMIARRAVRDIDRYGLAKVDPAKNSFQVHRLVQALLRDRLTPEVREQYVANVHSLLASANPSDPDEQETWSRHEELSAHVVPANLVEGTRDEVRRVVLDQIRYRWVRGDLESSRELAALAASRWTTMLGPAHEHTLVAEQQRAMALRALGSVTEARNLNKEIYELSVASLGADHEITISIGNSRGADLRLLGDWPAAQALDVDLLAIHRSIFGLDDRNTFRAANNLAVDYRLMARFDEARIVDEETFSRLQNTLGNEHPDTLRMFSNLARDYYGLGNYQEALDLLNEWLPTQRRVLGEEHTEVIKSTRIHVITLRKIGSPVEAYEMGRILAETARRSLGGNAPDTILALMTYSNCLTAVGQLTEARVVGEDAVEALRSRLGAEHPFTLAASTNLATVMRLLVHHPTARELDEQSLAGFRSRLGDDHLYTYCASMNLANDLAVAGEVEAARDLNKEALDGLVRTYGEEHPQTVSCRQNYVLDLEATGNAEAARVARQETIAQFRRVYGPHHPQTRSMETGRRSSIDIEPPNW